MIFISQKIKEDEIINDSQYEIFHKNKKFQPLPIKK